MLLALSGFRRLRKDCRCINHVRSSVCHCEHAPERGSICKFTLCATNDWRALALSFVFVNFGT